MYKGYKVLLLPTPEQEVLFKKSSDIMRFAYNRAKTLADLCYRLTGKTLSQVDLTKYFTRIKKYPKYSWLKEVSADIPKQAAIDYITARKNSFSRYGNGFHTRYKSKNDVKQGFYAEYQKTKVRTKSVWISRIGEVRTSKQLPKNKKLSNPRVTYDGLNWWLSISIETPDEHIVKSTSNVSLGIDIGIKDLVVVSDGRIFQNINKTTKVKRLMIREKHLQRKMSKKYRKNLKVQSKNYYKTKKEHASVLKKLTNIRNNHIHQVSNAVTKTKPQRIVIEDLSVSNMIKNSRLSKSILNAKWGMLINCITYKCHNRGIGLVKANRWFPSSQLCSNCGEKYDNSRQNKPWGLKVREWNCTNCGSYHDRDINAAINLSRYSE